MCFQKSANAESSHNSTRPTAAEYLRYGRRVKCLELYLLGYLGSHGSSAGSTERSDMEFNEMLSLRQRSQLQVGLGTRSAGEGLRNRFLS